MVYRQYRGEWGVRKVRKSRWEITIWHVRCGRLMKLLSPGLNKCQGKQKNKQYEVAFCSRKVERPP